MSGAVLFYVQHLLGIGHTRRALRLVAAMAGEGLAVTLVSGGEPLAETGECGAARVVQLPPVHARDASFALVDGAGEPVGEAVWRARQAMLLEAVARARPDAVVFETYPFGRHKFWPEIDALLAWARAQRPQARLIASVRDIVIVGNKPQRRREIVERACALDAVLVHGDPAFIPLDASFPEAAELGGRLRYTGYVGDDTGDADAADGRGEVLVSAGGGAVGGRLLHAAIEARRLGCLADAAWRILAGPNLPEREFADLAADLPNGVILERYRRDFPARLRHCRVSVSQAGYNTTLDILAAGAPAVVVPFSGAAETEQSLRAERLAAVGAWETIAETELSPTALARAIERAAARSPRAAPIDTGGAARTAHIVAAMIAASRPVREFALTDRKGIIAR